MEMSGSGESEATAVKPLVLPILKFSYTTTSAERNSPLGWTHLSGGADLVVIFDHVKVPDQHSGLPKDTRYLRVQRGMEVLEELNLGSLAQEASAGAAHAQPQNLRSSIAVLVKSPCLAIRYPTSINQIRRFQVKFSCDADYYKAISILSEIGCPITESTTGTSHPPASSYQAKPGSSGLISSTAPSVSTTVQPYSAADVPTIRPSSALQDTRPSSIGSSSTLSAVPGPRNDRMPTSSTNFPRCPDLQPLNDRPSTAPSFQNPESLSKILPPKRELPFAKPSTRTARNNRPKPTTASTSTSGIQANFTGIPSTEPPQRWSPYISPYNRHLQAATAGSDPFTAQRQLSQDSAKTQAPPSSLPQKQLPEFSLSQQQQQPDFPSANRSPLTTTAPTFINQLTTTTTSYSPQSTNPQPLNPPPSTPSNIIAPHQAQDPTPAQTLPATDLSTYLSTPMPERHAQLESWVCQQLESDGFLALCQDVEGVWRRVAYGH